MRQREGLLPPMSATTYHFSNARVVCFLLLIVLFSAGLLGCAQGLASNPPLTTPIAFLPGPKPDAGSLPPKASGHLVFVSNRDGNPSIYTMNADGSGARRLTRSVEEDSWPTYSPDGKHILYEATETGHSKLVLIDSDGNNLKSLTAGPAQDEFPTWSPDGSHIAFTSDRGGHVGIYVMKADGSGVTLLTDHPSNNWFPVWSLGGNSIAFISDRDGTNGNIFTMDPSGNHLRQVTMQTGLAAKPSWAPNGKSLAVFAHGGFFTITSNGDDMRSVVSEGEDPAWSRDGEWIAFASRREGDRLQIYLVRPDGSSAQRISNGPTEDSEPSWGP